MSKISGFVIICALAFGGCQGGEKIRADYVAPDFVVELEKINAQVALAIPDDASVSVQLIYEMHMDKAMKSTMRLMQPEMMRVAIASDPNFDVEYAQFFQEISFEEIDAIMPDLMNDFAGIYEEVFTQEELQQMLAFYRTPVGMKMLESQSILMAKGAAIGTDLQSRLETRLLARSGEYKKKKVSDE